LKLPICLGNSLVVFACVTQSAFKIWCRSVVHKLRFVVSVSANGYQMSYGGTAWNIDSVQDFESTHDLCLRIQASTMRYFVRSQREYPLTFKIQIL
jgi:hypothetical protein